MDDTEQQIARLRQIEDMKPRKGAFILLIPIFSVIAVFMLYAGMFALGLSGREAAGERVTLQWQACEGAEEVVSRRVTYMGLGNPEIQFTDGVLKVTATLPAEPDVAARIPSTLAAPGVLRGTREHQPDVEMLTNADVVQSAMRQDITLMPWTVLTLTDEAQQRLLAFVMEKRDGKVTYTLDGQVVGTVSNLKGAPHELELSPVGTDDRDRMHKAAERTAILHGGPLPCTLTPIVGATP